MKIKPLQNRIVIELIEEKSPSGIYLPKHEENIGKVVACGCGKVLKDGNKLPMQVKVGDTVVFSKYSTTKVKHDNKDCIIITEDDVLGIIEE